MQLVGLKFLLSGFIYFAIRVVSFPISGGYVNVARSFGGMMVSGDAWKYSWIYLLASPMGAVLATGIWLYLHQLKIAIDPSFRDDEPEDDSSR